MTQLIAVALLLFAAAPEQSAPVVRGRLCIGVEKVPMTSCTDVTGTRLAVTPADTNRLFVWTSEDETTAHLGVILAKAESIDVATDGPTSAMQLTIEGDRTRGWPAQAGIAVSGKSQWRWTLDARAAARLRRIIAPRGTYAIELFVERHRRFLRTKIAANEPDVALGELRLQPLPVVRGVVIDSDEKPVANAIVTKDDGTVCTNANEQGAFECELDESRIEALVVSKEGFGPRELQLPRGLDRDLDLGRITLSSGRRLTVKIVRPEATPARLTLFQDSKERYEHSKLKTVDLKEREEEVHFDVAEGKYLVLVSGSGSLERLEVPVEIESEDVTETITVAPYRLLGNVRFGEELLADGTAEIIAPEHTWRARVPIANGAFGGTMWQTGKVKAFILEELLTSPELGTDPTRWDVHVEKRLIAGRVFDAGTKEAVPGAIMGLTAATGDAKRYTTVELEQDGSFEIIANRPGTYSLRVTSPAHAVWSSDVIVTAEDKLKKVDVALDRGIVQLLELVTPSGAPVANATFLEGVQPDRNNPQYITRADGTGRYELRGKAGETRLLYVVPPDGSFAVVRTQIPRQNEESRPLRVVVQPGTSSLRVRAAYADETPAAAQLLIRYDGEFVPAAILRFVTREYVGTRASGEVLLPRLPAGAYEVWATAGERDEEALIASNGALRPPARVGLSGGEQTVRVVAPAREVRRRP